MGIAITQPNLTALTRTSPTSGPAVTFTGLVPDLDHYKGSFGGRVYPLWNDSQATTSNVKPSLMQCLATAYGIGVLPADVMAYIAATTAHPTYSARFQGDLSTPGLRIPITADAAVFSHAIELGRRVLWLHTFGERMIDAQEGRSSQPPRLPYDRRPAIPKEGVISEEPDDMPDGLLYDAGKQRLLVGHGFIENVTPAIWAYDVSGKQVLLQWFSYRKKNRDRPVIGDRRLPSKLGDIQPDHWLPEYTTELLNVLNILGLLIDLEPEQALLLEQICAGTLISEDDLKIAGALDTTATVKKGKKSKMDLLPQLF